MERKRITRTAVATALITAAFFNAAALTAVDKLKPMVDTTLWTKKIIPPNGEPYSIIIQLEDGGEWVSLMPSDLENAGNNNRRVCVEGRFLKTVEKNRRTVLQIYGSDRDFIIENPESLIGLTGNDHLLICGTARAFPDGGGSGCYLSVSNVYRLLVPAKTRYKNEQTLYTNQGSWQCLLDLIRRMEFYIKTDPMAAADMKGGLSILWTDALMLKADDSSTTDAKNPDHLVAIAQQFLDNTLSKDRAQQLVKPALSINPKHLGAMRLQPQVWPSARLWTDDGAVPAVEKWVESSEYARLEEERIRMIEDQKRQEEEKRLAHLRFLLEREPAREKILYDVISSWKAQPSAATATTRRLIRETIQSATEDDERLLQKIIMASLQQTTEANAIELLSAAVVNPIGNVGRDAIAGLVWIDTDASLNALYSIVKSYEDPGRKQLLIDHTTMALKQHATLSSVNLLVRMANEPDLFWSRGAIDALKEVTGRETIQTGAGWTRWFDDNKAKGDIELFHPYSN